MESSERHIGQKDENGETKNDVLNSSTPSTMRLYGVVAAFAPAPSRIEVMPNAMQGAAAAEQALWCIPAGAVCPCFAKAFHQAWAAKGREHPSKIVDRTP